MPTCRKENNSRKESRLHTQFRIPKRKATCPKNEMAQGRSGSDLREAGKQILAVQTLQDFFHGSGEVLRDVRPGAGDQELVGVLDRLQIGVGVLRGERVDLDVRRLACGRPP